MGCTTSKATQTTSAESPGSPTVEDGVMAAGFHGVEDTRRLPSQLGSPDCACVGKPGSRPGLASLWGDKVQYPREPTKVLYPPDIEPIGEIITRTSDEKRLGVAIGSCLRMGPRPDQEDVVDVHISGEKSQVFAGVYDGHGGVAVANYLKHHLKKHVFAKLEEVHSPHAAFEQSFAEVDKQLCQLYEAENTGSCATVLTIAGDALMCANVGDCDGCLCKSGQAYELTTRHNCSNTNEVQRIRNAGGKVVTFAGGLRVAAVLAVTRAFGDAAIKGDPSGKGLCACPDVTLIKLDGTEEFVIMGSDGLFEKFPSKQELVNLTKRLLRETKDVSLAAERLVDITVEDRHTNDNTSVVIIMLNQNGVNTSDRNIMGEDRGYASNHHPTNLRSRKVCYESQKAEQDFRRASQIDIQYQVSSIINESEEDEELEEGGNSEGEDEPEENARDSRDSRDSSETEQDVDQGFHIKSTSSEDVNNLSASMERDSSSNLTRDTGQLVAG
eukprot:gb/GECG01014336.1/.p1 GENE.gb/GECG01014336.1/~~gb/GECG01014336.1/.p1  ORF type:complete len:498 (+),score=74.37 gb/GECG01014336.1/:1-1494(+)